MAKSLAHKLKERIVKDMRVEPLDEQTIPIRTYAGRTQMNNGAFVWAMKLKNGKIIGSWYSMKRVLKAKEWIECEIKSSGLYGNSSNDIGIEIGLHE